MPLRSIQRDVRHTLIATKFKASFFRLRRFTRYPRCDAITPTAKTAPHWTLSSDALDAIGNPGASEGPSNQGSNCAAYSGLLLSTVNFFKRLSLGQFVTFP